MIELVSGMPDTTRFALHARSYIPPAKLWSEGGFGMTTNTGTSTQRFWKRVDAFGRSLQRFIGIAILVIGVLIFGGATAAGVYGYFRGIGWRQSVIEVESAAIVLVALYLARRPLGRFAHRFTVMALRFLYYATATVFYVAAVAATLSLLSLIIGSISSFLTAPIGIKPATEVSGLGEFFFPLFLTAVVSGFVYAIGRYCKDEVRAFLTIPTSSSNDESLSLPVKSA
jgi:hypothetical protein